MEGNLWRHPRLATAEASVKFIDDGLRVCYLQVSHAST